MEMDQHTITEYTCDRCSERVMVCYRDVPEDNVCTECKTVIGKKPHDSSGVCYFCGDEWGYTKVRMCFNCLNDSRTNKEPI